MDNANQQISKTVIMDYVRSNKFKGTLDVGEDCFTWDLDGVFFRFSVYDNQTDVEYFVNKESDDPIGKLIKDNAEVLPLIEQINDENKMVEVTKYFFGICNSFMVVDKSVGKKKSRLFVRRYYSC